MTEKNTRLAQYLRLLRESHENTQDELASMLGVTRQTYSHYENCRLVPSTETLYRIAVFYDIPIEKMIRIAVDNKMDGQVLAEDDLDYDNDMVSDQTGHVKMFARHQAYSEFLDALSKCNRKPKDLTMEEIKFYFENLYQEDQELIKELLQSLYMASNNRRRE
ncbi:MAG: helix-turn-helix transcriptional regulator [Butyrivibrio sp.]|nr:helix-turn-helix transcriptional regulator [Butyrivibrio sp.]